MKQEQVELKRKCSRSSCVYLIYQKFAFSLNVIPTNWASHFASKLRSRFSRDYLEDAEAIIAPRKIVYELCVFYHFPD